MHLAGGVAELVATLVVLLLIAAGTRAASERVGVPFTVALVLVGIGLSQLGAHGPEFVRPFARYQVSPDVILYVFLPTLVFEAAFDLDARHFRENLAPILTLAIPGVLLSTAVFGAVLALVTPLDWPAALLLGAMLSNTDPTGVIALFRQIGAPVRLTVLVDGESLLNDATSIVLSRLLVAIAAAGVVTAGTAVDGAVQFVLVFFGGLLVGWAAALAAAYLIGRAAAQPFQAISLTAVLAYLSYLAAEALQVSGIMAVVAAGVTLAARSRTRLTAAVETQVEGFWKYLAFVANALIFLLVGLRVDLGALADAPGMLGWTILAMLVSRAAVVYGLVPVLHRLPETDPIDWRYRTVMFWGGLRGAVAIAIALSLTGYAHADTFVALVTGGTLFTLLVQGLTTAPLVHRVGLDRPPLADRLAHTEAILSAKRRALDRIPDLEALGLFSARIAERLRERCGDGIRDARQSLEALHASELDRETERRLLFLRGFAVERTLYHELLRRAHLSEGAYRDIVHSIDRQADAIRHQGRIPEYTLHPPSGERLENLVFRLLDRLAGFTSLPERLRASRTVRDYEAAWGRAQGSARVLQELDALARAETARPQVVDEVRAYYQFWQESARERLDATGAQFPEFAAAMQERLAERLVLHAEHEAVEEQARAGTIPEGVAERLAAELAAEIRGLRAAEAGRLRVDPAELLRTVPFFGGTPREEFEQVAHRLRPRTAPAGEVILRQGEAGDSLFLIARGVVRVSRTEKGLSRDVATLFAGDFFGEMALLHGEPRTATCRAVTPCALYELRRRDLDEVGAVCPAIRQALAAADRERRARLAADFA